MDSQAQGDGHYEKKVSSLIALLYCFWLQQCLSLETVASHGKRNERRSGSLSVKFLVACSYTLRTNRCI